MDDKNEDLVIGGGPLARAVVRALVRRSRRVRVATRSGALVGLPEGVETVTADVSDANQVARAAAGVRAVFQCAQPPYHQWVALFPALQRGVIEGCRTVGARLIVAENLYGYGPVGVPLVETMPMAATTRKGRLRAELTRELLAAHGRGDVRVVIARGSDFFGPFVGGSAVGDRFFLAALRGRALDVIGDPDASHAWTFIDDFGEAMAILAERDEALGRAWHVPNAPPVSVRSFADQTRSAAGSRSSLRIVPPWMLRAMGVFVPNMREMVEMLYEFEEPFLVDDRAFTQTFQMTATPLAQSIPRTVDWYRQAVRFSGARPAA
jgi:nucleoside-diphosphate-sugar epimerase